MTVAYSVDGTAGVITITGDDTGAQELASINERYVDISFGTDWAVSGTGTFNVVSKYRINGGAYYSVEYMVDTATDTVVSITLADTGVALTTVPVSVAHTPGTPVNLHIKSTDRQQIRVWTGVEPSTWDIDEVEDSLPSGSIALGLFTSIAGPAPAAITPAFMIGFELGYTPSVQTFPTSKCYYNSSVNLTHTAPGGGRDGIGIAGIVDVTNGNGGIEVLPGNYVAEITRMSLVFYIQYTTLPSANSEVYRILNENGNTHVLSYRQSDSRLIFETAIGPVITTDTWYRIDVKAVTQGATTITIDWQVNDVAQTQFVENTGGTSSRMIAHYFGPYNGNTATLRLLIDDIVAEFGGTTPLTSYPLGETVVKRLGPTATITQGAQTDAMGRFTLNGGSMDATFNAANILAAISEFPIVFGGSAAGAYCIATGGTDANVTFPMDTYTLQDGESIAGVRWVAATWANTAGFQSCNVQATGLINGALSQILYNSANGAMQNISTPQLFASMYNPTGGWSQSALDGLEFTWRSPSDNAPEPGFHYMGAEVAIRTGTGIVRAEFDDLEVFACVEEVED